MNEEFKLMDIKESSWHYRLNKFMWPKIFKDDDVENGCLYFWLAIFAIMLAPIVFPIYYIIILPIKLVFRWLDKRIEKKINKWISERDPIDITTYWEYDNRYYNWISKFGKKVDYRKIYTAWAKLKGYDISADRQKFYDEIILPNRMEYFKRKDKENSIKILKKQKRKETESRIAEAIIKPFNWIANYFKFDNAGKIIKNAKRITGLILTAAFAFGLFFIVQWLILGILLIIQGWTMDVTYICIAAGAIALSIIILIFFIKWLYIVAPNFIKYISNTWVSTFLKWIIFWPLYGIFHIFVYKILCKNVIWLALKSFWKAFLLFGGVFGDYFGKSFKDYCPGINLIKK